MSSKNTRDTGSNIIPFKRKNNVPSEVKPVKDSPPAEIISIAARRKEMIQAERRNVTRTVFSQFMGVFVVLPKLGLQPVSIYDISEGGLAFDMAEDMGTFNTGEIVTLRIYLSHDTYFSFSVVVSNLRASDGSGISRHGAVFKKNDDSYKTLFFFSKFLENMASVIRKDNGDKMSGTMDKV